MVVLLSQNSVIGGESVGGTVRAPVSATGSAVQLRSSNPSVTVPASVTIGQADESGLSSVNFPINSTSVVTPTCAIITATYGSVENRKLLKVLPFVAG